MMEITILQGSANVAFMVKRMPSPRLHGGLMTLCFLLSCRWVLAVDLAQTSNEFPINGPNSDLSQPTPSVMALPVTTPTNAPANQGSLPSVPRDGSATRKFYTITAELREISAFETSIAPSILVDFPSANSDFSARYTFTLTDYSRGGNQTAGSNDNSDQGSVDYTHEFVAQYQHSFSDRENLNLAEQFRYYTEPSIFESTGTPYRSGAYISNVFNGNLGSQWTPIISTTSTYSNTVIRYEDASVAQQENDVENTGSEVLNFAVLPKLVANVAAVVDDITYEESIRGFTNYTVYVGGGWYPLPSLSIVGSIGVSYVDADGGATAAFTPYGGLHINWTLGQRSVLQFDYLHTTVPTDQFGADGEIADRFSANFSYAITPNISTHLEGIITQSQVTDQLIVGGTIPSYSETDYGLDTGVTYHYNNYLDYETGIQVYGVSSGLSSRDYNRNQVYVGVRGTY
jgi:hypothetical protein